MEKQDKNRVVVKGYCFASLKAKTSYTVHVVLKIDGEVVGGACTYVAGKGQVCSHIALLFFLENLKQKGTTAIPTQTVTNCSSGMYHPNVTLSQNDFLTLHFIKQHMARPRK